ncbi:hypothetical protein [Microbacterium hominis]|uniref:Pilus assembly protein PilO n=1 Tax=Microbacterium hominis TaxID=162426 RepID=A0A7D4Q1B8_9MICO|nr:hypothetical protein [Microbacterium hominis]QKJ19698.1 hypothetical protein HQM25_10200 [Microbacterium hominis]
MPKQLINLIGIVACIGILALAVALVALPMFFQSLATQAQAAQVDATNGIYQAQVDGLRAEEERMDEINASVAALRTEIPATNKLDDVFELIARSAIGAGVEVQTITAGDAVAFVERTAALGPDEQPEAAPAPAADVTTDATADAAADGTADAAVEPAAAASTDPRRQVDFTFTITADDLGQATSFLDRLRAGPRLLGPIQSTVSPTGTGVTVTVSALTFVLPED